MNKTDRAALLLMYTMITKCCVAPYMSDEAQEKLNEELISATKTLREWAEIDAD